MREYIGRAVRRLTGTRQATIDTIEPGSIMVSPRKPIEPFDVAAITEVLDLATKIGAVLLDSGTGAIDTQTQIKFVAGVYGLEDVDVDVTYNTIVVSARRGAIEEISANSLSVCAPSPSMPSPSSVSARSPALGMKRGPAPASNRITLSPSRSRVTLQGWRISSRPHRSSRSAAVGGGGSTSSSRRVTSSTSPGRSQPPSRRGADSPFVGQRRRSTWLTHPIGRSPP